MDTTAVVTERFAEWICTQTYDRLPAEVRAKALDVIYDSVGCMAACSILPEVQAIVRVIEQQGSKPECTIIGYPVQASVINAAMANGGMAHGDEVDAVHSTSVGGHVAAGPVPTALTVGEWLNSSGKDLIRAVALAYEQRLLAPLDADERVQLDRLLRKLADGVGGLEPEDAID